jgi:hypothetical protein
MPDYQHTKIYYIPVGDEKYFGHTQQQYLSRRTAQHRKCYRKGNLCKVYVAARALGMSDKDLICVLVENYPCADVDEAKARERYFIEREGSLNARIPGRTQKERERTRTHKEAVNAYNRAYALKNPEAVKEYYHKYKLKNPEAVKESRRKYKLKNAEAFKESQRKYKSKNAAHINELARARRAAKKALMQTPIPASSPLPEKGPLRIERASE